METRAGGCQVLLALRVRVGPAPAPPGAEVLPGFAGRGAPVLLHPCCPRPGRAPLSVSPAVLSEQAGSYGEPGRLPGERVFLQESALLPGGRGEERLSAEANLRRSSLPLVRGWSEGPHVTGAGGGPSRSHGGQEGAGPRSGPSQPGASQGACSSCDSCSGTQSLALGPAPPALPSSSLPLWPGEPAPPWVDAAWSQAVG